ncbi:hypothetical protein AKJ51_04925, partial [candidate division MSBL1 archaeon SCGC-AAA382A20]
DDTSPEAHRIMIEGYRKMAPHEKMEQVNALTRNVREMALARIRREHPDCSEREMKLRLASLWLDRETMIKVFDWDPEEEGY